MNICLPAVSSPVLLRGWRTAFKSAKNQNRLPNMSKVSMKHIIINLTYKLAALAGWPQTIRPSRIENYTVSIFTFTLETSFSSSSISRHRHQNNKIILFLNLYESIDYYLGNEIKGVLDIKGVFTTKIHKNIP